MRTAVVTGGTVRLGLAISERLRTDGWRVLTTSHRADSGADIIADLSDPMGAARLYAEALRLNGGLPPEALVNNAALFRGDAETLRRTNAKSPNKLTMLMAGRENGRGVVVNILDSRTLGDASAQDAAGRDPEYTASKRNLLESTRRYAALFADTLRVNGVAPGPVMVSEDVHEKGGETPLGRPCAEDVADAVAFLLSAKSTTGCVIPVDGGQSVLM